MTTFDFNGRFEALTGHSPLKWQERLFRRFREGRLPSAIDLPTGLGKTAVMPIWYLARQAEAPVPCRLVYVVDRRAVVDQATAEAEKIAAHDPNLHVSTLRGQFADNRKWLGDPASPAIVVGTVDMIGSRLLFGGYGVSRGMRPYHAGLLGVDTLVVLDESHLVPPFERLLAQIAGNADFGPKEEPGHTRIPSFRLLPLSATGRDRGGDVFQLEEEDNQDPVVRARLDATKRLTFEPVGDKALEESLSEQAWAMSGEGEAAVRILVYCDSRDVAEKTRAAIEKRAKGTPAVDIETALFVGARRVKEREDAKDELKEPGFLSGGKSPGYPAFVVATSAGEVGVDLDADHMVMDLVPFERMVQRLGRVNRLGEKDSRVVVVHDDGARPGSNRPGSKKKDASGEAEKRAMLAREAGKLLRDKLPQYPDDTRDADDSHDASPGALVQLKKQHAAAVQAASTPAPLYPALNRPLVDAWSMTSLPEHTGRPEVRPWLRGWVDDEAQTTLVWRAHLPVRTEGDAASPAEIDAFFAAAPPHLTEKLETVTWQVKDWLAERLKKLTGNADNKRIRAFLLGGTNEQKRTFRLEDLADAVRDKDRFIRAFAGMTLVLDAHMGGLKDGLLDNESSEPVSAADACDGWFDEEAGGPLVPFRVRSVRVTETTETDGGQNWRPAHSFDAERDAEGDAVVQLVVEKWPGEESGEDSRAITRKEQSLEEHQAWTARKAKAIVDRLEDLPGDIGNAIVLAARLHDEGKQAAVWQRAFSAPRNGKPDRKPYAKTRGPFRPGILAGYRHEFGSLAHVEDNREFGKLPADLKDLVLHLVAAHHGRARPVIETTGCADGPPGLLEARARDVALRFARLQKRFGPWGLAWLEALVRAADQQASRDLDNDPDKGRPFHG